jgi:hypothetical protein
MSAWTRIAHIEVGSGGQAELEFLNIPATYDDLLLLFSTRTEGGGDGIIVRMDLTLNDLTTNRSSRVLYGRGDGTVASTTSASEISWFYSVSNSATSNTFANNIIYIPNYRLSQNKSVSIDSVTETNASNNIMSIVAGFWANTAAISSMQIFTNGTSNDIDQYSSATLYGITKGSSGGVTVS